MRLFIERQLGGELVEVGVQFGVKLGGHMLAEQAAQAPSGHQNRRGDPEQGAGQQAKAQRAAQRTEVHCGALRR